ncbi:MAG: BatA domain-containing protein, partial [Bacteroidales bacterium]|nr:BatA domain-containing protein [Bacteroidales bacterium]
MLTQPLFLIGLAAIAIPIAIHLLQLRRYRKVYFSNVDMLQELENENRRQRNLRQLLILAARILAILFIVLAFCQPVIPHKDSRLQSGGTVVSVYVDNSYSMECGGMEGSLIETAKQKAREIAAAYDPSISFQLLTNNASGSQFRWLSREEFLSAVDDIQAGAVTTPLSSITLRQYEFLHSSSATNRHAYIISDFQRTTADLADCPADTAILTTLIPLGGSALANVYLDSLLFNSPAYFPGATVQVEVHVHNGSDKPIEKQPLRLYVGNQQRAVTSVDIPANSTATASLSFTIQDDSIMAGYVETTDYPVTFDDRLYFSLPVTSRIPLLVVSGKA